MQNSSISILPVYISVDLHSVDCSRRSPREKSLQCFFDKWRSHGRAGEEKDDRQSALEANISLFVSLPKEDYRKDGRH
jgi:hypothetical protein